MIRMIQSQSAGHAKAYFSGALAKADYYIGDQEINGIFRGRLSNRLGVTGMVTRDQFFALCENRHPETGQPLTPRTKKGRTVGYDINFHVPKSVSILHALAKDDHILEAFRDCVAVTMQDIEAQAKARVRRSGVYADRITGELLWVDFIHQTARPVDGYAPDPHLHAHCYVFNITWDETEQRLKAGQFRDINKEMPYFQALFHKRLADKLVNLGYEVRPTDKSFEVDVVPKEVIALFSKRTDEIGRVAKEKGITDARELSELGARTRAKKQSGMSMAELKEEWKEQIRVHEAMNKHTGDDTPVRFNPVKKLPVPEHFRPVKGVAAQHQQLTAEQCRDYSLSHCFERASVVPFSRLTTTALKYGIGSKVPAEIILDSLREAPQLIQVQEGERTLCTTREVLREEQRMVQLARTGKNSMTPLYIALPKIRAVGQQGEAIRHILTTSDRVSIVRGAAGAGKTTLMTEAIRHIEQAGKQVTVVAPTARASRGTLRDEGFVKAQTVSSLLNDAKMQQALTHQVLWVDEAGMLGTKDMVALLDIASRQNAKVILGGDTRQHTSVVRGDALRILSTVAGIRSAEVNKIYRQKEEVYRKAVADLAKGDIYDGFQKLDSIGAIKEGYGHFLSDYMKAVENGKEVLVISPTHKQGEVLTKLIRTNLKEKGYIGKRELEVERLKNLNLTGAEKTDRHNMKEGMVVQFNQNRQGIKRGSRWEITALNEGGIQISDKAGRLTRLELNNTEQFDLYRKSYIPLAKGDKIQITRNGFDKERKRLDNGLVLEVVAANKKNGVLLKNPKSETHYMVDADFGNLNYAHCITSHASQGKTVDEVFIAQSAATFPATNAKQFYVSVSRAREKVHIYTDDKEELLYRASQAGDRTSATELIKTRDKHVEHLMLLERQQQNTLGISPSMLPGKEYNPSKDINTDYEDYESGF